MSSEAEAETDVEIPSTDDSLRDSDFNKLWIGQGISVLGSELTVLALPLTAILTLHADAAQIGYLESARTVAVLIIMLFAGVLVDRVRRRPVMILTDLGRAVCVAAVPVFALANHLSMPVLYVVAVLIGALQVIFDLSRFAYLPTLVTRQRLVSANSRMQATESLGGIFGSTLGGVLVTVFRPALVLFADAASFLVSAVSILLIRTPEPALTPGPAREQPLVRGVFSDIVRGIKVTYTNRYVGPMALNATGANFGSMMVLTLFILWANRELHISPGWIGVIYGFGAAGGVAGAVLTTWSAERLGFGRALLGSMLVYRSLVLTPFVVIVGPKSLRIIIFCVIWFLTVFGVVMSNILAGALQQHVIPSSLQGRVGAASRFLGNGVVPLAALVAGLCGQYFGLRPAIIIGALVMPFPLLWVFFSPARHIGDLATDAPAGDPDGPGVVAGRSRSAGSGESHLPREAGPEAELSATVEPGLQAHLEDELEAERIRSGDQGPPQGR